MEMLDKSEELSESIALINTIDSIKFSKFLTRVVDKVDQNYGEIFSEEEELKLKTIFSINDIKKVKLIIKSVHYLLKQIVYNVMKPKILVKELTELGLETEKTVIFGEIWSKNASKLIDRLKERSFDISDNRLSDMNWTIKLMTDQSCRSDTTPVPLAQLDLTLRNGKHRNRNISIDLDRHELWNLYESIEAIQTQLDSLHK